ncbi:hypothetical protein SAMD00079811_45220 [Scytonema sp. HK-05]|uniref:hypothetical protein n=1 Tax=Scytonema sp. HK-05 TaxID=1137095 RepID=UPI00093588DE|nr:hypothetical protein [Scytonema sp. HK-05]OKH46991.1 hypothetical protein NIES2130_36340 [Scytonema sp. HK-05]BAY46906.1 hypothetical protein SAMD00079811_45220 [Scytonema sp. HK-05]
MTENRFQQEPKTNRRGSNAFSGFLMGVLFTLLLVLGAGIWLVIKNPRLQQMLLGQTNPNVATSSPTANTAATPAVAPTASPLETTNTETTDTQTTSTDTSPLLPPPQTLNLQVNHANGTVVRLTEISFAEDSTKVNLAVTNGHKDPIKLNNSKDMVLIDNLGNQYNLVAPPDNSEIEIQPGTTLKGEFVFLGRMSPSATSFSLATNNMSGSDQSYSTLPKIRVADIPVKGP